MTDRRHPASNVPTVLELRVHTVEEAIRTMADSMINNATEQAKFNTRVEIFMTAVRTWGKVGLLVYGAGQALIVGVILYGIQQLTH